MAHAHHDRYVEWLEDRRAVAEVADAQEDDDLSRDLEGGRSTSQAAIAQYGRTLTIPSQVGDPIGGPSAQSWTTIIQPPDQEDPTIPIDWSLSIQPSFIPLYPLGQLFARVSYTQGGVRFFRGPYPILSLTPQRMHVCGGRVQIDVVYLVDIEAPAGSIAVTAGARPGGVADSPLDFYFGQWSQSVGYAGPVSNVAGPGVLMAYQAIVQVMSGDAQMYLCWYDVPSAASLVIGTTPSAWTSPPFTAAGQWYAMHEQDDEKIFFNSGLVSAWSSAPDVYQPPTGNPSGWFKTKVGF